MARGDQFFFTAGEFVRDAVLEAVQSQQVQGFADHVPDPVMAQPQVQRTKGHILGHGRAEKLIVGVLEDKTDPVSHFPEIGLHPPRTAHDFHPAGQRGQKTHDDMNQGGLARSIGPDQSGSLPRHKAEIEVVQDRIFPVVGKEDALEPDQRIGISHCPMERARIRPVMSTRKKASPKRRVK